MKPAPHDRSAVTSMGTRRCVRAHVPPEHRSGAPFHGGRGGEIVSQPSGRRVTFSAGQDVCAEKGKERDLRARG